MQKPDEDGVLGESALPVPAPEAVGEVRGQAMQKPLRHHDQVDGLARIGMSFPKQIRMGAKVYTHEL